MLISFPPRIYRAFGPSDVVPYLLEALAPDIPVAIQFLRQGVVRVTFSDAVPCTDLLEGGLWIDDIRLEVRSADPRLRTVYLRDLPFEVSDDDISSFLSRFGVVRSVSSSHHKDFPHVLDGNRSALVLLTQDIPCFARIAGSDCRIWYARQPIQCAICRVTGHRASDCPLFGRCRRCKKPGHIARDCRRVWPVASSAVSPVDGPSAVAGSVADPVESVDESVDDVLESAVDAVVASADTVPAVDVVSVADPVVAVDVVSNVAVTDTVAVAVTPCVADHVPVVPVAADLAAGFVSDAVLCSVQDHSTGEYCPSVWIPSSRRMRVSSLFEPGEFGFIDAGKHTAQVINKDLHVDYCRYLQYLNTPEIRPAICRPKVSAECLPDIPPRRFPGVSP